MADALKHLYSPTWIADLAQACNEAYPHFDAEFFIAYVMDAAWEARELKARTAHIAESLAAYLPNDFETAVQLLDKIAARFTGYPAVVFPEFIRRYGLSVPAFSLRYLERWTPYSTAEFALRPFLIHHPELTLKTVHTWTQHPNEHVRRLASEGIRPRLPWAEALPEFKKNPAPVLQVLEKLKDDTSEYVRRSVANNLNDISKDHPVLVLQTAQTWMQNAPTERQKLIRHALRTMLKAGHTEALAITGVIAHVGQIEAHVVPEQKEAAKGECVSIKMSVQNKETLPVKMRMEYKVHYCKVNAGTSAKVFWLAEGELKPGEVRHFNKKLNFTDLTTRKHYPGLHTIQLCVNGIAVAESSVSLLAP